MHSNLFATTLLLSILPSLTVAQNPALGAPYATITAFTPAQVRLSLPIQSLN